MLNMRFKIGRKVQAKCPGAVLFQVLEDDLRDGLCTDISFKVEGKKHRFGAWGDKGETKSNVVFYLDKFECRSLTELKEKACISGQKLTNIAEVIVTECDGCYPDSTPILKQYI